MTSRVFIFGASGMLGSMTARYLADKGRTVIPLSRDKFDAENDSIEHFAKEYAPTKDDLIINAVGLTNRQLGTLSEATFMAVNADLPKALDTLAGMTGCRFIHITTDCVFDGTQGGYWERSAPHPTDVYATSKLAGETLSHAIVLRTSLIGIETNHFHNLISWVLAQNGKTIRGYTNHTWNGITTLECAKIIDRFVRDGFPANDLYHIYSSRIVTKYDLVKLIADAFDLKIDVTPFQTERPVLRHLVSEKGLCTDLAIRDISVQLEEMRHYCDTARVQWKSL